MALTFLTLAQRARRRCRMPGTGPTALTGQSEEYNRLIDWVNEAYMQILRMHGGRWSFMRATCSCPTVQGRTNYSPTTDFGLTDWGAWALNYANGDTFRVYNTTSGLASEIRLALMDYDDWRDTYLIGSLRTSYSQPVQIAQAPDFTLCTGPIAAAGYTLLGDYWRLPTEMVAATDVPVFEDQFRMAIVYKVMQMYGGSEAAPEVLDEGRMEFEKIIRQMEMRYLPRVTL